jgi:DNA-directed RNA polymerase
MQDETLQQWRNNYRSDPMVDEQYEREAEHMAQSIDRFEARNEDLIFKYTRGSDTDAGGTLIKDHFEKVRKEIEALMLAESAKKHKQPWYKLLKNMPVEQLALVALPQSLNVAMASEGQATARATVAKAARDAQITTRYEELGRMIHRQAKLDGDEKARNPFKDTEKKLKTTGNQFTREQILQREATRAGVTDVEWSDREMQAVGGFLLHATVAATGLIERKTSANMNRRLARKTRLKKQVKQETRYILTEPAIDKIEEINDIIKTASPIRRYMVCKPLDWVSPTEGGFLISRKGNEVISNTRAAHLDILDESPTAEHVFDALNVAQNTQWRVSRGILAELQRANEADDPMVPTAKMPERPAALPDEVRDRFNDKTATEEDRHLSFNLTQAKKEWENECRERGAKRQAFNQSLNTALEDADRSSIYAPIRADRRGRLYPMVGPLAMTGNDIDRGLLELARGHKVGPNGFSEARRRLATCYGHTKMNWEEREDWVVENEEAVMRAAICPQAADSLHRSAKEPFQFLAGCIEYFGMMVMGDDLEQYESHLTSNKDAVASAVQIMSTLVADADGANKSAVLPCERPTDLYLGVAASINEELRNPQSDLEEEAVPYWIVDGEPVVTREHVKTAIMIQNYSATDFRQREKIEKAVKHGPADDKMFAKRAAATLHPLILRTLAREIPRLADVMAHLRLLAIAMAEEGKHMDWLAPFDGFVSERLYHPDKKSRLKDLWAGPMERVHIVLTTSDKSKVDPKSAANGIAPNFIHSLDSAFLREVIRRLNEEGVDDMFLCHDSIGVPIGQTDILECVLRETYAEMFVDQDWLQQIEARVLYELEGTEAGADLLERQQELAHLRRLGDLDITQVIESEYFFN